MAHTHSVIDDDLHFIIDPSTREIGNGSQKVKLIQYDHNSEQFTFEIPRFVEGHDMSLCNSIRVNYININKSTREQNPGVYEVSDTQVGEDNIIFSWLVSRNATQYVGPLNFLIKFMCFDEDDNVIYEWHTDIFKSTSVSTGMNIEESIEEVYPDILEKWKNDVLAAEESRVIAESGRVTAESERAAAESGRVTAESERVAAESERVNAETERVAAESERVTAESERVAAESERVAAESERVTAESERVNAESERVASESERIAAESERVNAESERVTAESKRVNAESERATAESERVTAESERVTAESERAAAESKRVTAESERVSAESERATAESKRVTAESERVTAESERATAESERVTAESERVAAESERATAESERATAESERATAESERVNAESERANIFAGYETEINQFKNEIVTGKDSATDNTKFAIGEAEPNLEVPSMEEFNKLADDMTGKLTEPAEGLAVGKYFRVAALDENGHAVLEAVDAKTVGVQDVQVAGASVVADGVANVPIMKNQAFGVAKIMPAYGVNILKEGQLSLMSASEYDVDTRISNYRCITPNRIDYTVKAAMCDGKGAAWTADEQAAARERMGISGYELVCDVTLEEAIDDFVRDTYSDGAPYNLSKALVFIYVPVQESGYVPGVCWIYFKNSKKFNAGRLYYMSKASINRQFIFKAEQIISNGVWSSPAGECGQEYSQSVRMNVYNTKTTISNICAVQITCSLPAGTTIQIYGVRA